MQTQSISTTICASNMLLITLISLIIVQLSSAETSEDIDYEIYSSTRLIYERLCHELIISTGKLEFPAEKVNQLKECEKLGPEREVSFYATSLISLTNLFF